MKLRPPKGATNVTVGGMLVGDEGVEVSESAGKDLLAAGWTRIVPPKPPKKAPTPTKDDPK